MPAQFTPTTRPVVVGVDGSDSALDATRWGAREAARRRAALHLVEAFGWTRDTVVGNPALGEELRSELLVEARRRLADAVMAAERAEPSVTVSTDLLTGFPVGVLDEQTSEAQLLVLGSRGLGGLAGLLVGSVAVTLAAQASCPVVVVRGERHDATAAGPVVVGVDGSPSSEAAIAFAYEAAATRGVPLVALHAWSDMQFAPALAPLLEWQPVAEQEEIVLAERLAGWAEKYPDVQVRRVIARDDAAAALVELSRDAQLLVVGSRGRGNVAGLLLGSASHSVLHGSHCPVAVVRPDTATSTGSA